MSFVTLTGWGVDQRNMFGSRFPINNLQSQIDGFAARPFRHTLRFRFSFAMLETRKRGQEVLDVDCVGDVSEWGAPKSPPKKKHVCQQKLLGWEILRYIQLEQMGTMERLSCCMGGGSCGTLQWLRKSKSGLVLFARLVMSPGASRISSIGRSRSRIRRQQMRDLTLPSLVRWQTLLRMGFAMRHNTQSLGEPSLC